jgi:hypothetical protein
VRPDPPRKLIVCATLSARFPEICNSISNGGAVHPCSGSSARNCSINFFLPACRSQGKRCANCGIQLSTSSSARCGVDFSVPINNMRRPIPVEISKSRLYSEIPIRILPVNVSMQFGALKGIHSIKLEDRGPSPLNFRIISPTVFTWIRVSKDLRSLLGLYTQRANTLN